MRKLLTVLLVLFLFTTPVFAAVDAATVWEIRTTGAQTNSGGFKTGASGSDFSQQAAAQYVLTSVGAAGASKTGIDYRIVIGNDFTPGTGSPALDVAVTLGTYSDQIGGEPDIGAIEAAAAAGGGGSIIGGGVVK